ncbi:phage major capsid protein [[Mycobacterium] burgundiense]|uniref:Phage major capsid protein n=1 Tax=[Mycobacterium] burgundiense TaxID=3064286 RepID=A0ABM9L9G9_9MYCO|nr:phage major capsid protein [Mycolicibacterium sp. MU0053]CAJ1495102.1 phage major capsid protein [Mycolicibacterium sp. MU0053]
MATHTTPTSPKAWAPDQTAYVPGDVIPDALLLTTSTVVGSIEGDEPAVRVPFVANDGTVGFVAEGATIPDADQDFDEVVVLTGKIATLGKYSYETLQQPEAARLVVESLSRNVIRKANAAYLGNAAIADGPTGLLNIVGITNGGVIGPDLDAVVDAVAGIEAAGGTATHIIAAPDAWASLSKLKRADTSNESLVGAGTVAAERALLSLPVFVTPDMPSHEILVGDRSAIVAAQSLVRLARSEDAYFSADVIGVRLTWRLGWNVMHPDRVAKLSTLELGS